MSGFGSFLASLLLIASAVGAIILSLWMAANRSNRDGPAIHTALALAITALWALSSFTLGNDNVITVMTVSGSYLGWLWALYRYFAHDERDKRVAPVRPVILALAFVAFVQIALSVAWLDYVQRPEAQQAIAGFSVVFRLLFCIGALVLVHNLYTGTVQQARQSLRWPAAAMATMWLFDLNLCTIAYLNGSMPVWLQSLRGGALLVMVALLAYGTLRRETDLRLRPSRSFAFRSFSLLVIGAYVAIIVLVTQGIAYIGMEFARLVQIGSLALAGALALAFLPSKRLRSWVRVTLAKNLFQHRYDYRAEWLRFTETIGRAGPQAAPLHERAVQAVADITDSSQGLLLTPCEEGGLALDARWQWPDIDVPAQALSEAGQRFFEQSHFILDLDDLRGQRAEGIPVEASPQWLLNDADAWALVPLLHYERLVGVVVLARPPVRRRLDWEDFDLLRVIGRQLASYLAEQGSQDALGEAQRFDEFNRRIAFVMHDIKNLASQLSLLAGNAEKHADKPAFRADMILTLRNSTDKLQALLQRLGRYGAQGGGAIGEIALADLLDRIVTRFADQHEIIVLHRESCRIKGDAEAIEQALVHLVQNAIDASEADCAVMLDLRKDAASAVVEVVDSGSGMSPEFVRTRLFKPFHSSKPGGFGIGAFEARELVRASGGRLDVESREGLGTRFLVRFPLSGTASLLKSLNSPQNPKEEAA